MSPDNYALPSLKPIGLRGWLGWDDECAAIDGGCGHLRGRLLIFVSLFSRGSDDFVFPREGE